MNIGCSNVPLASIPQSTVVTSVLTHSWMCAFCLRWPFLSALELVACGIAPAIELGSPLFLSSSFFLGPDRRTRKLQRRRRRFPLLFPRTGIRPPFYLTWAKYRLSYVGRAHYTYRGARPFASLFEWLFSPCFFVFAVPSPPHFCFPPPSVFTFLQCLLSFSPAFLPSFRFVLLSVVAHRERRRWAATVPRPRNGCHAGPNRSGAAVTSRATRVMDARRCRRISSGLQARPCAVAGAITRMAGWLLPRSSSGFFSVVARARACVHEARCGRFAPENGQTERRSGSLAVLPGR